MQKFVSTQDDQVMVVVIVCLVLRMIISLLGVKSMPKESRALCSLKTDYCNQIKDQAKKQYERFSNLLCKTNKTTIYVVFKL
jgi:hypothetical protein